MTVIVHIIFNHIFVNLDFFSRSHGYDIFWMATKKPELQLYYNNDQGKIPDEELNYTGRKHTGSDVWKNVH